MYRILIADDEEKTRQGLKSYFENAYSGILEVCAIAENGIEALDLAEKNSPDVILTDIKMPQMTGIELAGIIRKKHPEIKIIFISGYDDTDYLKSALSVDAVDYIFKPIDFEELNNVIGQTLNLIQADIASRENMMEIDRKLKKSMPLLRDKFFINIIRGGYSNESKIFEQIDFLGLSIHKGVEYCIIVAEVDNYMNWSSKMTERERQAFSFGVINIISEIISEYVCGFTFENAQGEFVSFIELPDDSCNDKIYIVAETVRDSIRKYLECEISIGIGENVNNLNDVQRSYSMAKRALKTKLFLGNSNIIAIDETDSVTDDGNSVFWEDKISSIESVILNNDKKHLDLFFKDLTENMYKKRCSKVICQMNFIFLITKIQQIVTRIGNIGDLKIKPTDVIETLCNSDTIDTMYGAACKFAYDVMEYIANIRKTKSTNAIEEAKQIIREHYADNITIEDIAEKVYLTSAYLCVLFKQETGYTITDYKTLVRIDAAKRLLKDPANKIYDIAYSVGYENPSYFSLQFKRITGMLPKDYRETIKYEKGSL